MVRRLVFVLLLGAAGLVTTLISSGSVTALGASQATSDSTKRIAAPRDSTLWIEMRDVDLHVSEENALRISALRGEVTSTSPGSIPVLDDPASFRIRVTSGVVALTGSDLAALLNDYVFAYKGSPLRNLRARTEGSQVVISGIMHKGVDLPFEMTSTLSLEPDGRIRSHPTHMRMLGVNGALLLHALGLHLDKVLDVRGSRGASVKGDDLFLEPTRIVPPPTIDGRLASIRVVGDRIVQTFIQTPDDAEAAARFHPDTAAHHFVYFRGGGRLTFGKLTMTDTDLLIVDGDQSDPFDLYMAKYNVQLVVGYTKNLPNYGLRATMPDYGRVKDRTQAVATKP